MAVAVHAWSPARALDVGWRVLVMALVYSVLMLPASLAQAGGSPAVQIGASLVTGAAYALLMLPLLATMTGRDRRSLLLVAAYIALIDAAVEGWLPMLAQPSYPLGFKLAEGVGDLGTDAIARGAFLALLLALPAARRPTAPPG